MSSNSTHNNPHDSTSSAIRSSIDNHDAEDEEERGTQHEGDEEEDRVGSNDGDDYDPDSDNDEMPPLEGDEENETDDDDTAGSEEDVRVTAVRRRLLTRYGFLSNTERSAFRSRMSDYRQEMNLTVYEFMLHLYENPELIHRLIRPRERNENEEKDDD